MRRRDLFPLAAAGLFAPSVLPAQGTWPERPVRIVVPLPPGGSNDTFARLMAPKLAETLGQEIAVENRSGASGSVGAMEAARSPADGHTWLLVNDNEATNQTSARVNYRLMQVFAPMSLVATGPLALVAHQSAPWQTFGDVVAAAKAAPDTIGFSTAGVGSLSHVSTTLLQVMGDFKLKHVPFNGGSPALQSILSGRTPLLMANVVLTSQHIKAGTLRPLGVTTTGETPHLPGVKSFAQQGFAGFEAPTWWAFLGRAGTPEPILRRMSEALTRVLAMPEVHGRIRELGADVLLGGGQERCRRFVGNEIEKWRRVMGDNNIVLDSISA